MLHFLIILASLVYGGREHLEHDTRQKDKRLVLPVPFGCAIEHARDEAEKAIRDLAVEIGSISVKAA